MLQYEKSCLSATRKNLAKIKGFSEQKVEKIKEAAAKCAVWPTLNFDTKDMHGGG